MKKNVLAKLFGFGLTFTLCAANIVSAYAEEAAAETVIELSDEQILVNGAEITSDASAAVYAGAEIVYYEEGQDETYGEGDEDDGHSAEEAAAHTVVTITQPGTYRVSGSISKGQIAVDLGEEAEDDETAVVSLILDNANIACDVASAIVVYNAYECGDDDEDSATKDVDTANAGFNLILADGSENVINGSHVAKIYEDGTTAEQVENDEAEKKWKFDAAIDSLVSFNISGEEAGDGKLNVTADNEGISSALHLTVNGGEINVVSSDDCFNASEDYVSVMTVNNGSITCNSSLGTEGDGIDSNGWLIFNGGTTTASANPTSQDSGIDSDLGIYINGGTVVASGNMYDEVSSDSAQPFAVFSFAETVDAGALLTLKNSSEEEAASINAVNAFQILVYSSETLTEGDYTFYKDDVQLQGTSGGMMGMNMGGGRGGFGGQMPEGMKLPEGAETGEIPEMPEGMELPEGAEDREMPEMSEGMELPEGAEGREMPEMPEGMELPEGAEGREMPEMPEGMEPPEGVEAGEVPQRQNSADDGEQTASVTFTIQGTANQFAQIQKAE